MRSRNFEGQRDVRALLMSATIIFCVFPYFSPVRLAIDTSPLYLITAATLVAVGFARREIEIPRHFVAILGTFSLLGTATILKGLAYGDANSLRVGAGLVAQCLLILAAAAAFSGPGAASRLRTSLRFLARALYYGGLLWLLAALLQVFSALSDTDAGEIIVQMVVTATRTTEGRGFTSLATEPSFAGITGCLLAATSLALWKNRLMPPRHAIIAITCYIVVALLSLSLVSYLALLTMGLLTARKITLWLVLIGVVLIGFMFVPWEVVRELRIAYLVRTLVESPALVLADVSTASRAADLLSRVLALGVDHSWAGHFFDTAPFTTQQLAIQQVGGDVGVQLSRGLAHSGPTARAMSSIGVLAFEFGVPGILAYCWSQANLYRATRKQHFRRAGALIALSTFGYLVQLPFSFPSATVFLSIFAFFGHHASCVRPARAADLDSHRWLAASGSQSTI